MGHHFAPLLKEFANSVALPVRTAAQGSYVNRVDMEKFHEALDFPDVRPDALHIELTSSPNPPHQSRVPRRRKAPFEIKRMSTEHSREELQFSFHEQYTDNTVITTACSPSILSFWGSRTGCKMLFFPVPPGRIRFASDQALRSWKRVDNLCQGGPGKGISLPAAADTEGSWHGQ